MFKGYMLHLSFSDRQNSSNMGFYRSCRSTIIIFDIYFKSQSPAKIPRMTHLWFGSSPPNKYPVDVDDMREKLFESKVLMIWERWRIKLWCHPEMTALLKWGGILGWDRNAQVLHCEEEPSLHHIYSRVRTCNHHTHLEEVISYP